jgi:hypothetical protein
MAIITRSQTVSATIDTVFDTITGGGNFAAWNPTIRSSRRLDAGEVGNGSRFEWDLRGFGRVEQDCRSSTGPRRFASCPTSSGWQVVTVFG